MPKISIRPRFKIEVPMKIDEIVSAIRHRIDDPSEKIAGTVLPEYAVLKIPIEDQHYWSPELSLSLEETENGTIVRGLFGPRPVVWTLFASFYAFTAFALLIGIFVGYPQWSLGQTPYALWLIPVALILFGSAYAVALSGQKLGQKEMLHLRNILSDILSVEKSLIL